MPEGITALSRLETLNVSHPFGLVGRLPPRLSALPLETLALYHSRLDRPDALQELARLTSLQVQIFSAETNVGSPNRYQASEQVLSQYAYLVCLPVFAPVTVSALLAVLRARGGGGGGGEIPEPSVSVRVDAAMLDCILTALLALLTASNLTHHYQRLVRLSGPVVHCLSLAPELSSALRLPGLPPIRR